MATVSDKTDDVPKLKFLGSVHEGIPVASDKLEECIAFYTNVLGLKLLPRPAALDKIAGGAWLGDEDDTVQFHLIANDDTLVPGEDARIEPAGRHTAWRIEDIDAFRDRMRALDVPFQEISSLIGEAQVFVLDPQGHTWEFQGRTGIK
ncbi:MAG: VOC family protein [Proteobacteria bacterium]|nr:VOC family protein [Pseudomonadota bacterium]